MHLRYHSVLKLEMDELDELQQQKTTSDSNQESSIGGTGIGIKHLV